MADASMLHLKLAASGTALVSSRLFCRCLHARLDGARGRPAGTVTSRGCSRMERRLHLLQANRPVHPPSHACARSPFHTMQAILSTCAQQSPGPRPLWPTWRACMSSCLPALVAALQRRRLHPRAACGQACAGSTGASRILGRLCPCLLAAVATFPRAPFHHTGTPAA